MINSSTLLHAGAVYPANPEEEDEALINVMYRLHFVQYHLICNVYITFEPR